MPDKSKKFVNNFIFVSSIKTQNQAYLFTDDSYYFVERFTFY